jgi:putative nucleotidyltransferase with HDIG domain
MSAGWGPAAAGLAALGTAVAAQVVCAEICPRLDVLSRALVRVASLRLPRDIRGDLAEEWLAELEAILKDREALPLTRLTAGTLFAVGLLRAAPDVAAACLGGTGRSKRVADWVMAACAVLGVSCTIAAWRLQGGYAPAELLPSLVVIPVWSVRRAGRQFREHRDVGEAVTAVLCQAMEAKDLYTLGHCERVARGAVALARELGLRADRVEAVRRAALLHDIGKLGVPTDVLRKAGPLTEGEYGVIQVHTLRGTQIASEMQLDPEVIAGIFHHHERVDGRGYPMGLAGDEIPEIARIVAVVDAFDSMTSTRAYRHARRIEDAIAHLRTGAGSQFDPDFVEAFIRALERQGWLLARAGGPDSGAGR